MGSNVHLQPWSVAGPVWFSKKPCGGTFSCSTPEADLTFCRSRRGYESGFHSLRRSAMQGFEEDHTGPAADHFITLPTGHWTGSGGANR